jgi:hypothetical protein
VGEFHFNFKYSDEERRSIIENTEKIIGYNYTKAKLHNTCPICHKENTLKSTIDYENYRIVQSCTNEDCGASQIFNEFGCILLNFKGVDNVGGYHSNGISISPFGQNCNECSSITCESCPRYLYEKERQFNNRRGMKYKPQVQMA